MRWVVPEGVVMDAWDSSLDDLKATRSHGGIWISTLRKNRIVNHNLKVASLDILEEGISVHLRGYGLVTVLKFLTKQGRIHYITMNNENPIRAQMRAVTEARCSVELYHREIKQTCDIAKLFNFS